MKFAAFTLGLVFLTSAAMNAQQDDVRPEKLVGWMRAVNTLEAEYKMSHNRFADLQELLAFARDGKQTASATAFAKELSPTAIQPWLLRVVTSADGSHYLALIKLPSDMHNEATWCKTEAYSDDSGLISLGQNIQCSATNALGASSKPMK